MAGALISDLPNIGSLVDNTLLEVEDTGASYNATMLQILNYIISSGGGLPPGSITEFASDTIPSGWLLCDGQAVSRTTYSALFTAISTTWGVGDGSTTFNVPDFREASPYGVGTRASGVTAHDAATLGEFKDDQLQGHFTQTGYLASGTGTAFTNSSSNPNSGTFTANSTSQARAPISDGVNGTPRTGATTRGKLIGVNFIIKY